MSFLRSKNRKLPPDPNKNEKNSVRAVVLMGVFWRILIIEGILLVGTLIYAALTEDKGSVELFWYALRIISLVAIIVLFMMVTLKSFLEKRIISPLESIAEANKRFQNDDSSPNDVNLPEGAPKEINGIVLSRRQMLDTILKISEERLHLVKFIRNTFGRYLSKRVVDEILESPNGQEIGGRRKTVTVVMSDLRGFTSLAETRDPEDMVRLLNRYLERMSKVIMEYDGMIDEFIGDAILTVFGVPEERDDDPLRAVACALTMQNALVELNNELTHEGYPELEMGIGINTGSVIVGNIGSEIRAKYGIVGATVNMASRIESNTVGGEVLMGESTHRLVKKSVTAAPPHTVMMKGLKRPLVIYPVTAIGAPYNVNLDPQTANQDSIELNLPFHCWKVEDKKMASKAISGETVILNENLITASVEPHLEPLTDIKLIFDFCMEAHCFDDIYAKVLSVEEQNNKTLTRFRITSINQKDRDILKKWTSEAS
ncbi:MAG: adenylate/guanylate cyclase domain-containing protein [Desulfobacteraceae bacterium]|uniref:Adenylate/guanylate cyclase domain-containing protein n=1 Tax=Candidatus Desulfacyla euxinica TaxID=2841693 RepID=A0A8J6MW09_9DELT|nr:adenylate/guanylate cyclase domain-containing protein [Candidatus Desulfacyla euxinica]MBL6977592.1 adenylate/guanylate cyclase domain-containing protein [Desulfobacteraceae bacterium]MBL7217905.1 adenylate/guanylate cyclase domain-containing protein [Desulfobacteraceae bacterium]